MLNIRNIKKGSYGVCFAEIIKAMHFLMTVTDINNDEKLPLVLNTAKLRTVRASTVGTALSALHDTKSQANLGKPTTE